MDVRGKRITVLGLAREGIDLTRFLCAQGASVRVSDRRTADELADAVQQLQALPLRWSLGGHPAEELLDADLLFVSPGIPQSLPVIEEARRRGIRVTSATQLLLELAPCPVIGLTGSSGKTTTTSLVGRMLQAGGRHALVGGNIGVPLLGRLGELNPQSWLVLELSSFQLETVDRSPSIATITNVTPNHLDRHGTMEAYTAAKERILRFQGPADWAVLNAEDPVSARLNPPGRRVVFALARPSGPTVEGAFLDGEDLVLEMDGRRARVCRVDEVRLRGRHNLANILAACATAAAAGTPTDAIRTAAVTFTGVAHRLEAVAEHQGVRYVNDSIATSPERSMAALRAFTEPLILIAGGRDKHLPMEAWAELIVRRARHVVLLGEMSDLVAQAIRAADPTYAAISRATTMDEAVAQAAAVARPGDVVLLSPGGTSFDLFSDFEARGRAFTAAAQRLSGAPGA